MQRTYNVILRQVFNHCCSGKVTSITYSWECVCSLRYAACNTLAPYCLLPPASTVFFSLYLTNGTIIEKRLLKTKCVLWFSLQPLCETFVILRKTERDFENVCWSSCKVCYSRQILMTLKFSRQIFRKILKYQISWNCVQWEASCSMRMDRQTWWS